MLIPVVRVIFFSKHRSRCGAFLPWLGVLKLLAMVEIKEGQTFDPRLRDKRLTSLDARGGTKPSTIPKHFSMA